MWGATFQFPIIFLIHLAIQHIGHGYTATHRPFSIHAYIVPRGVLQNCGMNGIPSQMRYDRDIFAYFKSSSNTLIFKQTFNEWLYYELCYNFILRLILTCTFTYNHIMHSTFEWDLPVSALYKCNVIIIIIIYSQTDNW